MNWETESKIIKCKEQIKNNNDLILKASKENIRLFESLLSMMKELPEEQKLRYDKELASDGWKKYSEKFKNDRNLIKKKQIDQQNENKTRI